MITRWEMLTKKAGMSTQDFMKHWNEKHGALEMQCNGLQHLIHNEVTDSQQRGVAFPRCSVDADAMTELWFNDLRDMNLAMDAQGAKLAESCKEFTESVLTLVTIKNTVIPIQDKPLLKRVSFIQRLGNVSLENYKHEWWDIHGDYVRQFKGVRGYCQSLILDRLIDGKSVPYEKAPIDGIVELYFEDLAGLEGDFASEVGKTAQGHGRTFLQAISTYIVEKHSLKA